MKRKYFLALLAILPAMQACFVDDIGEQIDNAIDNYDRSQKPVAFSLDAGDLGMALEDSGDVNAAATQPTSNLRRINTAGELQAAITQGTLMVQDVVVGPDRKVYVVADNQFNISGPETDENGQPIDYVAPCVIWQLDNASLSATCIENSSIRVFKFQNGAGGVSIRPEPIQFDDAGGVYYYFETMGQSGGNLGLRRYKDGATTDLLNDNVTIFTFFVAGDGTVYISGETRSNGAHWFRRITTGGALENINNEGVDFIAEFPDGNLYVSVAGQGGVSRYLPDEAAMDATDWIQGYSTPAIPYRYGCTLFQEPGAGAPPDACGNGVTKFVTTTDEQVYALVPHGGNDLTVMRYYPEVNTLATSVESVYLLEALGADLIIAGINVAEENALVRFNPATTSETDLLGDEDIEVYRLGIVRGGEHLMFDGLRFRDNKYVLCRAPIDGSAAPSCRETGDNKLLDLKILGD